MSDKSLNAYQRINEVRKAVAYVRKDKRVGEGGYMATTHDAVTALVRDHLITHGIVIVPSLITSKLELTGTATARGIPFVRYEARYRFEVVNADMPEDRFCLEIESHAIDQGDKAPGKALSYAKKYAILKLLEIESGEEEEERQDQHKPKITPRAGVMESMSPDQKNKVLDISTAVIDFLNEDNEWEAYNLIETSNLDTEEKIALWDTFDSKVRRKLKAMKEKEKANAKG